MDTGQTQAEKPEPTPAGTKPPEPAAPQAPPSSAKGEQRNFVAALVLGAILNGIVACGFFLVFEDNPTLLYSAWNRILVWLFINLVIWGIAALATKLPFRGFAGGLGLAALIMLSLEALYLLGEYPLPTAEQRCTDAQEVYAAVLAMEKIDSSTTPAAAQELYDDYLDTKSTVHSLGYILYMPAIPEIGINERLIQGILDDLQSQDRVGPPATGQLRAAVLVLKNTFSGFVRAACDRR